MSQESPTVSVTGASAPIAEVIQSRGALRVLVAGVVTTVLALGGVWWLDNNTTDFHVMGWYGDYVIPAGALLVGMAAGSGYGIASYLTGLRIRRGVLLAVLALQLGGYAAAQYLEFRSLTREGPLVDVDGETLTFARYYHLRAVNFAWDDHGRPGQPIGEWGYLFLGLGVIGFALGGVLAPALLMKVPYCERCSLYMKGRMLALVPASTPNQRISKKDTAGRAALAEKHDHAAAAAGAVLMRISTLAARGDAPGLQAVFAGYPCKGREARRLDRLAARMRIRLVRCRQCGGGYIEPAMITGQGRGIRAKLLDRLPLPADATRVIAGV